jgi:hypothetical protein
LGSGGSKGLECTDYAISSRVYGGGEEWTYGNQGGDEEGGFGEHQWLGASLMASRLLAEGLI